MDKSITRTVKLSTGERTWVPVPVIWHQNLRWRVLCACMVWCARNGDEEHSEVSRRSCNSYPEGCNIPCADHHDACWWALNPQLRSNRRYRFSGSECRCAGSATRYRHPTAAPVIPTRNPPCYWPCLWDPFCQTWTKRPPRERWSSLKRKENNT